MTCAKVKEVMKMKSEFIRQWGIKQLEEDYNRAKSASRKGH